MSADFRHVPTLQGQHCQLQPLAREHSSALAEAARDGRLWELWYTSVPSPDSVDAYVQRALDECAQGHSLPFVVRDAQGLVVGSTRYCHIDASVPRVEIGYTWYAKRVQCTALNTEAKRLLLAHAFDVLGCVAVEFRTHYMNHASRNAIARLGAKQDGILRNHMRMPDGSLRDTVVFSILANEWSTVRRHLDFKLQQECLG
jgi:RimJ/RimL family protein N-acetyltransferase